MKFGIFYEHQLPRPWAEGAEQRLLHEALEQIEIADRIGLDHVWEVEHHFLEEYSHSSAPEVFLAAASQRTSRIRLGHGIVALPPAYNHPARVAERVATLDIVSNGRVELGTGETSSNIELDAFGVARADKRAQWAESLDVVTRMFVEQPFAGYDGTFVTMPPRNLVPRPVQRPHPPLWVACSRRETIHLAAEKGIGALSFAFVESGEARSFVEDYYRTIEGEGCVPAGFAVNPNVAVVLPFMLDEDEETAIDKGLDGAHFFAYSLGHYYIYGSHRPGRTDVWSEFEERRSLFGFDKAIAAQKGRPLGARLWDGGNLASSLRGAIGTPAQVRQFLHEYAEVGVDEVILVAQCGKNRHEDICRSLELFADQVLPDFAEHEAERERDKMERLAPAIETALARRSLAREIDPQAVPSTPQA